MENIGPTLRSAIPENPSPGLSSLADIFDIQEVDTPFVGLRPFEIPDGPLFFGRREQTDELLQRLHRTRFVAVVGGSGCGKSSLVRAGLIPALQAGFLVADRDTWATFTMKPGDQPLRNLTAALPPEEGKPASFEETAAGIRMFGVDAVLDRLQPSIAAGCNILLVVDQFEETFRFGLEGDEDRRDEAAEFILILLALAQKADLPIYVVLTMRSDFMGDCDAFPGFAEAMNRSLYLVPRLTRQQRREAIEGPIRMAGAAICPRLLDRLLNESDMASDQLPVLQHALMRTWEEWRKDEDALAAQPSKGNGSPSPAGILGRPLRQPQIGIEHYQRAGTLDKALDQHAEEALEGLDLDLTRKIFQALTDVDIANRKIRRPARMSVLEKVTSGTREAIEEILRRFQSDGRCFVVWASPEGHPDPLIDLSHESLIRCWKRLAQWVEEEAESAAVYRRLETATVRRQRGGDLWRDTDLHQALDWRAAHDVGLDWAARVRASEVFRKPTWKRPTFEQVLEFLEKSRAARDEEHERKKAQERELLLAQERERQAQERERQVQELARVREEQLAQAQELVRVRDETLAQAQELARVREEQLAQAEEQEKTRKRWHTWMKAISAVAATLAIAAIGIAWYLSKTKSELENVVLSTRLTQQSKALAVANPQLGVLLAAEALAIAPQDVRSTKEPENALRSALASIGGRGLGGHYRNVTSIAVSPDGRWLVSGGLDGVARRWKLADPRPEKTGEMIFEAGGADAEHQSVVRVATAPGKVAIGGAGGIVRLDGQDIPLKTGDADISALAFDASGRWLVAGDVKGDVWLWNLSARSARKVPLEKNHKKPVTIAEFSHDGRWLVTASATETGDSENRGESRELMVLWQLVVGQVPRAMKVEGVSTVDLSGDRLAAGFRNGTVELWQLGDADVEKVGKTRLVPARGSLEPAPVFIQPVFIQAIALSPNGKIAAAAEDGSIAFWDGMHETEAFLIPQENQDKKDQKDPKLITHLEISPGGSWLVAYGSSVRLRPLSHHGLEGDGFELRGHGGGVETVAFSPNQPGGLDSRWLFTGGSDGTVRRWNLAAVDPSSDTVLHRGQWLESGPRVIELSPDRNWLIAGDEKGSELRYLGGKIQEKLPDLASARISEDSRWLLIVRGGKPDDKYFEVRRLIPGHRSEIVKKFRDASAAAIAPHPSDSNDAWLFTGQKNDGSVWIRRALATGFEGEPFLTLKGAKEPVDQIVITPDRRYVLVARAQGNQGTVQIRRLSDLKMVFEDRNLGNPKIVASPDSRWFAIADAANVTRLVDLKSGPVRHGIRNNLNISTIAFAPVPDQAGRLVLGFENGTVKSYLLSEKAPAEERILEGHQGSIFSLAVSQDGRRLATGGTDGTARVWDLTDRLSSPSVISVGTDKVDSFRSVLRSVIIKLAFHERDEALLTVGLDGTVSRWALTESRLREEAERAVGRNMYENEWCKYFSEWYRDSSRDYQLTFDDLPSLELNGTCTPGTSGESSQPVPLPR